MKNLMPKGDIQIVLGKSADVLRTMDSSSVDMVLTDPPYNVGLDYGEDGWQDKLPPKKYWQAMEEVTWEARRVLKQHAWYVFTMHPGMVFKWNEVMERLGLQRKWMCVWAKPKQMNGSSPVFGTGHFVPSWEAILCYSKGKAPPIGEGNGHARVSDVWLMDRPFEVGHPAARPVQMWEELLCLFTAKGQTVLDPFGGSGTTALVAQRTGRKCIVVEMNPEYANLAVQRVLAVKHQTRLSIMEA